MITTVNQAGGAMKEKIKRESIQALNKKYGDGNMVIDSSALVIYGEK
jgi:hypothetical protein